MGLWREHVPPNVQTESLKQGQGNGTPGASHRGREHSATAALWNDGVARDRGSRGCFVKPRTRRNHTIRSRNTRSGLKRRKDENTGKRRGMASVWSGRSGHARQDQAAEGDTHWRLRGWAQGAHVVPWVAAVTTQGHVCGTLRPLAWHVKTPCNMTSQQGCRRHLTRSRTKMGPTQRNDNHRPWLAGWPACRPFFAGAAHSCAANAPGRW